MITRITPGTQKKEPVILFFNFRKGYAAAGIFSESLPPCRRKRWFSAMNLKKEHPLVYYKCLLNNISQMLFHTTEQKK